MHSSAKMDYSFLPDIDFVHNNDDNNNNNNNNNNNTLVDHDDAFLPVKADAFSITIAVLYLVICVLGLAGNSLVAVAILKLDKMASATTVYIFNLALADGLFMVGLPFVAIQNFKNHWAKNLPFLIEDYEEQPGLQPHIKSVARSAGPSP